MSICNTCNTRIAIIIFSSRVILHPLSKLYNQIKRIYNNEPRKQPFKSSCHLDTSIKSKHHKAEVLPSTRAAYLSSASISAVIAVIKPDSASIQSVTLGDCRFFCALILCIHFFSPLSGFRTLQKTLIVRFRP